MPQHSVIATPTDIKIDTPNNNDSNEVEEEDHSNDVEMEDHDGEEISEDGNQVEGNDVSNVDDLEEPLISGGMAATLQLLKHRGDLKNNTHQSTTKNNNFNVQLVYKEDCPCDN